MTIPACFEGPVTWIVYRLMRFMAKYFGRDLSTKIKVCSLAPFIDQFVEVIHSQLLLFLPGNTILFAQIMEYDIGRRAIIHFPFNFKEFERLQSIQTILEDAEIDTSIRLYKDHDKKILYLRFEHELAVGLLTQAVTLILQTYFQLPIRHLIDISLSVPKYHSNKIIPSDPIYESSIRSE